MVGNAEKSSFIRFDFQKTLQSTDALCSLGCSFLCRSSSFYCLSRGLLCLIQTPIDTTREKLTSTALEVFLQYVNKT